VLASCESLLQSFTLIKLHGGAAGEKADIQPGLIKAIQLVWRAVILMLPSRRLRSCVISIDICTSTKQKPVVPGERLN
jgi:hypothetical protein